MMGKIYFILWYYYSCWYKLNLNFLIGICKNIKKNNFDFIEFLVLFDFEVNSLGFIVLKFIF